MRKKVMIIVVVVLLLFIVLFSTMLSHRKPTEGEKSEVDFFRDAEFQTAIEPLQTRFPWLEIKSCLWKYVVMGDSHVPGPTDILACGYIYVDNTYYDELNNSFEWFDSGITAQFAPTDTEEDTINLKTSEDYFDFCVLHQVHARVRFHVDFENHLLYFSGTFN